MSDWTAQFLDAFQRHRVDHQRGYYEKQGRTYERARRAAVAITACSLVLAALFGALGAADADRRVLWAVLAATTSAFATALLTFETAIGLERLSRQYDQTRRALILAAARRPRVTDYTQVDDNAIRDYVTQTERLLRSEVDTWSRVTEKSPDEPRHRPNPAPA
jgi:hypothetical protein